ncbi:MAG TPA: type VI secretion system ATPase TssH [Steroidobacteraceae bacterium]|jgi:type VI secretion system protein VasG|nr:type VI secretion system ATPase TssH [Steroidobacteraceae bacterium]
MSDISRVALFGKLNSLAYKAIESATVFCKLRGNPYVELVHWLHQILQLQSSDIHLIVRAFSVDPGKLARDMTEALDRLPRGASSISDLSAHIEDATERAWVWATLKYGEPRIRTGHVLIAMAKTPALRHALLAMSREFEKIKPDQLADDFPDIVASSPEAALGASDGSALAAAATPGEASGALPPAQLGKQEGLKRFTVDLTEQARLGKIDPVVGRDDEIRQIVDILMRRRQNNPILTGEAGVGKTAVVEGFARRIAAGDVPPSLKEVALRALDVGLLQAGASMKGEFEQRLRQVIDEVQASPKPIVLFIDEVHTLVGAGGAAGTGDAANLLKPALARGTLRTIGATTWAEYKKYIEKDPALTRRFQTVKVEEPTEDKALLMMRGVVSVMEKHHRVQVLDEALEAAVKLAHRYVPDRQLPDKSISLLDTACARVAVSHHATPAEVEDCQRRIEALQTELEIIGREAAIGIDTAERARSAESALRTERERLKGLHAAWEREKGIVDEILALRAKLRASAAAADKLAASAAQPSAAGEAAGSAAPASNTAASAAPSALSGAAPDAPLGEAEQVAARARLQELQKMLAQAQGDRPLVLPSVDEQAVATVIADWTGIPVGRMVKDEIATVLTLAKTLGQRVVGQDHALEMITRRIQTSRASLENPSKPIGVFMLAGPSGVGKTETALTLAEALYGGEQNLITINMSEFQEAHTVSTLKGAPPGYVGYGEGGVLTEAVRRKPYSVVLLDEVEKAHPDVHEIFFQVFDKGIMEDGEGRLIDFKNTLIILTTNVGTDLIMGMCKDPELLPDPDGIAKALRQPMLKTFPAALLGRIVVIPYYPLSDTVLGSIIRLQLDRVVERIRQNHGAELRYGEEVVRLIASRCTEPESGGRMIDAILTNTLLPRISRLFLERMSEGMATRAVTISVKQSEFEYSIA